jgi:uncharacterized membrane protein YdjX (TVP38/TMEM64 family)
MKVNKKMIFGFIVVALIVYINLQFKQRNVITLENLEYYRDYLINFVDQYWMISIIIYGLLYVLVITLALPGVAVMTFTGGALFPLKYAFIIVVVASTIGAIINFIMSRYFLQDFFEKIFSQSIRKINARIEKGGFKNLLILRTIPVFPYSMVNFALAISDLSMIKFIVVTVLGKIPGSLIIIYAGSNMAEVDSMRDLATPEMVLAILLLIGFILLPIFYKLKNRHEA